MAQKKRGLDKGQNTWWEQQERNMQGRFKKLEQRLKKKVD